MAITARTKVGDLLEEYPELDEVFENYDIEVTDELMSMSLKQVCKTEGLNYWELKSDIVEAVGWDGSTEGDLFDEEEDDDDEEWGEEEEGEKDDLDLGDDVDDPDDDDDDDDDDDEEDGDDDDDEEGGDDDDDF